MFDFTILALSGAFASGVGGTLDILANAARLAEKAGSAAPRWRVVSTRAAVDLSNGLKVAAEPLPRGARADRSVWLVPGLCVDNADAIADRLARPDAVDAIGHLTAHAKAGGTVAASCSAVFLIAAAGLLGGRRATTSWWLGGLLQQREPACVVDVNQMVVADGPVVTAGAAFAHIDLVLHLLRGRFTPGLAQAVSRTLVADGRQSQARFIMPAALASGSELAGRVVTRLEAALPHPPTVAELAAEFGMSERTLARHVKAATGHTISALLQSVRVSRARLLLESSRLSVEQVAAAVGYGDATALRRLMWKVTRATPRQFRSRAAATVGASVATAREAQSAS
ncbi:GlxA family transcriptional regulator [Chelatococcus reniformis]|uniref:Transcriptional regulator n=1 Tax=Chelatococcus reniformis TaxID=1494448 RepID=A0A916XNP7_9HYPH|nr:helix-turn-helix domain-containing protein [Chelatococcus reniformis]GGC86360.1 transcriptional regulator [Chelatococcus reniformis]